MGKRRSGGAGLAMPRAGGPRFTGRGRPALERFPPETVAAARARHALREVERTTRETYHAYLDAMHRAHEANRVVSELNYPVTRQIIEERRAALEAGDPVYRALREKERAAHDAVTAYDRGPAHAVYLATNHYEEEVWNSYPKEWTGQQKHDALEREPGYQEARRQYQEASREADRLSQAWHEANAAVTAREAGTPVAQPVTEEEVLRHPTMRAAAEEQRAARAASLETGTAHEAANASREAASGAHRQAMMAYDRAKGGIGIFLQGPPAALRTLRETLGPQARQAGRVLASILNARPGDEVSVLANQSKDVEGHRLPSVLVTQRGERSTASMILTRINDVTARELGHGTQAGDLWASDLSVESHKGDNGRSGGTGLDLLATLGAMRDAGVTHITFHAAGGPTYRDHYNGYQTWPKLGAQGAIPSERVRAAASARFGRPISRVEQVMDQPGGAAWWRDHGESFEGFMDLTPGGRAYRVLQNYEARLSGRGTR